LVVAVLHKNRWFFVLTSKGGSAKVKINQRSEDFLYQEGNGPMRLKIKAPLIHTYPTPFPMFQCLLQVLPDNTVFSLDTPGSYLFLTFKIGMMSFGTSIEIVSVSIIFLLQFHFQVVSQFCRKVYIPRISIGNVKRLAKWEK
jgi:hypothetical protein